MSQPPPAKFSPQLVLFDLGGVLVSLRPIEEVFPVEKYARTRRDRTSFREMLLEFRDTEVFDRFERGLAGTAEFCQALRDHFSVDGISDEEIEEHYLGVLGDEVPGMKSVVENLKRAGIRVAGLSDTSRLHLSALHRYPAVRSLETVIASCVTGRRKPDPETFRDALRRLGTQPGDVFFTDDNPANVEGAREAGLRAEVFRGPAALRKTLGLE